MYGMSCDADYRFWEPMAAFLAERPRFVMYVSGGTQHHVVALMRHPRLYC
jgi:hypothetical protein